MAIAVNVTEGPQGPAVPGHAALPHHPPSAVLLDRKPGSVCPSQLQLPFSSATRRAEPPNPVVCLRPPRNPETHLAGSQSWVSSGEWWCPNVA